MTVTEVKITEPQVKINDGQDGVEVLWEAYSVWIQPRVSRLIASGFVCVEKGSTTVRVVYLHHDMREVPEAVYDELVHYYKTIGLRRIARRKLCRQFT